MNGTSKLNTLLKGKTLRLFSQLFAFIVLCLIKRRPENHFKHFVDIFKVGKIKGNPIKTGVKVKIGVYSFLQEDMLNIKALMALL